MARRDMAAAPERARLELEFEQPYLLGPLFGPLVLRVDGKDRTLGATVANQVYVTPA